MIARSQFISEHSREERKTLMQLLVSKATNIASIEKVQLFEDNNGDLGQVDPATIAMRQQKLGALSANPIFSQNCKVD